MTPADPGIGIVDIPAATPVDDDMDREPTKEEIMDDIRQGIREAKAGKGPPALEVLAEIERELKLEQDACASLDRA